MISWHKVGQKVTCLNMDGKLWRKREGGPTFDGPETGKIYTISAVAISKNQAVRNAIVFELLEYGPGVRFGALNFEPVYPTIIDQLRKLDAPSPERVKEDAHV